MPTELSLCLSACEKVCFLVIFLFELIIYFFLHNFFSGINIFLDGFVPTENLRFRETSLVFKVSETATEEEIKKMRRYDYNAMKKTMGGSSKGSSHMRSHEGLSDLLFAEKCNALEIS